MVEEILKAYGMEEGISVTPHGSGLINNTWKVNHHSRDYILQRINNHVFKKPEQIADNIKRIGGYLKKNHPGYLFVAPVETKSGEEMIYVDNEGYFRLFPFVRNSHTIDVANKPSHAYEAARQFGLFTKLLAGFPADSLQITIPDFHNLSLRYTQFEDAVKNGNPVRKKQAQASIDFLSAHTGIVKTFDNLRTNKNFKLRVTHHDTKISNVLFDNDDKGLCVIDLDTVMPGYFISDVGDMMRTYLSSVSEEEKNVDLIDIREDYFENILRGYLHEMVFELTDEEINHFVYSGLFMIYMQAMRFLTDYLINDKYYGAAYEEHNFVRAKNQSTLLQRLLEKKDRLEAMVERAAKNLGSRI